MPFMPLRQCSLAKEKHIVIALSWFVGGFPFQTKIAHGLGENTDELTHDKYLTFHIIAALGKYIRAEKILKIHFSCTKILKLISNSGLGP